MMTILVIVSSATVFMALMWWWSRSAWGGGVKHADDEWLAQAGVADAPFAQRGFGLPIGDRELVVLLCRQCPYLQPLPPSGQLGGLLHLMAGAEQAAFPACPECAGVLHSALQRQIVHHSALGRLEFSTLRSDNSLLIEIDGRRYPSLAAIENHEQRQIVAEALNSSEDTE